LILRRRAAGEDFKREAKSYDRTGQQQVKLTLINGRELTVFNGKPCVPCLHLYEAVMVKWKEKACLNLLKLSQSKLDYLISAKEWEFNGNIIDHGNSNNTCELCEGENLRHHFQIENTKNKAKIWVGSSCIHKFDILVRNDEGIVIQDIEGKKKYLTRKLSDKKRELFLYTLRSLWKEIDDVDGKSVIYEVGTHYRDRIAIYPHLALSFLKLLNDYSKDIDLSQIKVSARDYYSIESIVRASANDRELLYKVLNSNQIEKIERRLQQVQLEEEQKKRHDARLDCQTQARAKERAASQKAHQASPKQEDIFIMPEFVTCSVCGQYTKDWVCLNPDICRECVGKRRP